MITQDAKSGRYKSRKRVGLFGENRRNSRNDGSRRVGFNVHVVLRARLRIGIYKQWGVFDFIVLKSGHCQQAEVQFVWALSVRLLRQERKVEELRRFYKSRYECFFQILNIKRIFPELSTLARLNE